MLAPSLPPNAGSGHEDMSLQLETSTQSEVSTECYLIMQVSPREPESFAILVDAIYAGDWAKGLTGSVQLPVLHSACCQERKTPAPYLKDEATYK